MSTAEPITIPNCACGKRMIVMKQCDAFACVNCDGIQPEETKGEGRRKKTPWDKAYEKEIDRRCREDWYPEQFKDDKKGKGKK